MLEEGSKYNQTFLGETEISNRLTPEIGSIDVNRILSAYTLAKDVHQYQRRNDGTPYFWHPTRVARIMIDELECRDADLLIAALLHDTLEDSDILNAEVLTYNFGEYVTFLVESLTKEIRVDDGPLREQIDRDYVERLKKAPEDCRVIKLCDRLDNLRCLGFNLKRNPFKYVQETSEHYLPMAETSNDPRMKYLLSEIRKERNKFLG